MSTFADAPEGDTAKGAKIFKTKCYQCHNAEPGTGNKQACTKPADGAVARIVVRGTTWTEATV